MKIVNAIAKIIVNTFYRKAEHADPLKVLGSVFLAQKILGINRFISWPCHFTSKIIHAKNIKIGHRSFPGWSPGCYIQAKNGIIIGNNLRMGPNVGIISANHDKNDYDSWLNTSPINIGSNVWIGMGAVILPGVNIGDNVIIAANSVVTHDIKSNSIAAGSPAKTIKEKKTYKGKTF